MKLNKITFLTIFLIIFFTLYPPNIYEQTTPNPLLEVECPEKLIENKDLPIHINAFTETDYIEYIIINLEVDGLSIDKLPMSRSHFNFEREFQDTVFLRFNKSQINKNSKVYIYFTLRDKYGNISKTYCEY